MFSRNDVFGLTSVGWHMQKFPFHFRNARVIVKLAFTQLVKADFQYVNGFLSKANCRNWTSVACESVRGYWSESEHWKWHRIFYKKYLLGKCFRRGENWPKVGRVAWRIIRLGASQKKNSSLWHYLAKSLPILKKNRQAVLLTATIQLSVCFFFQYTGTRLD